MRRFVVRQRAERFDHYFSASFFAHPQRRHAQKFRSALQTLLEGRQTHSSRGERAEIEVKPRVEHGVEAAEHFLELNATRNRGADAHAAENHASHEVEVVRPAAIQRVEKEQAALDGDVELRAAIPAVTAAQERGNAGAVGDRVGETQPVLGDGEQKAKALLEERLVDRLGGLIEEEKGIFLFGEVLEELAEEVVENGGEGSGAQGAAINRGTRENLENEELGGERIDRYACVSSDAEPL